MMLGRPPPRPVQPGLLDEILLEFSEHNVRPTKLNILRRAVELGCSDDLAATIASAFERMEEDA